MKILKLKLCNLASLAGEQEIDFESDALQHAGLIAITGKTGAGKSTLLDAMSLALYDQIPRLNGAVGTLQDASGQSISVKDSKHILRRGTVHGYAELEFLALDQKRYQARWEISRARKKLDGKLKVDRAIICLDDGRVLTQKISECSPMVKQLIGLDFEQFTRAVLLAQSEVGAFLKAKDQDRADLLEYLTNSSIFSLISQLSFEKTKQFKDELEQIKKISGHIELFSAEQIQDYEQQKDEFQQQLFTQQQQFKHLELAQQWYQQAQDLQQKITHQQQQLQTHQQQQTDIDRHKVLVQQLDEFADIRHHFVELENAQKQQQQLQQRQTQLSQTFGHIEAQYLDAKQQLHQTELHVKQQKQQFNDLSPIFAQALDYDAERLRIGKNYREKESELKQNQQYFDEQVLILDQLTQQQHSLKNQFETNQQAMAQYQNIATLTAEPKSSLEKIAYFLQQAQQLQQASQSLPNFSIADFSRLQQELTQHIQHHLSQYGDVEQISQRVQDLQQQIQDKLQQQHAAQALGRSVQNGLDIAQQQQQLQQALKQLKQQIDEQLQDVEQAQKADQHAEQHLLQVQQILAEQRLLQAEKIQDLRAALQPNQACMVCGSLEHPFIEHQNALQQALSQIQDQQEQQAKTAKVKTQQTLELTKQQLIEYQAAQSNQQQRLAELTTQFNQATSQLHIDFSVTALDIQLTHSFTQTQNFIVLQNDLNAALHTLQQQLEAQKVQLQDVQTQLQHSKQLQQRKQQQQQIANLLQNYQHAEQVIFQQLDTTWQTKWQQQPEQTAQQLNIDIGNSLKITQQLQQQQQQLQQLEQKVQQQQEKCNWLQSQTKNLSQQLQLIKIEGTQNTQRLKDLLAEHQTQQFDSGKAWQAHYTQQILVLEQQQHKQQQHLQQLEQDYQQQQKQLTELDSQIIVWTQQIAQHSAQQQQWLSQHPVFNTELITQCLAHSLSDIQQLRGKISQFDKQLGEIQTHLHIQQQHLAQLQHTKPQYEPGELQQQAQTLQLNIQQLQNQRDEIHAKLLSNAERTKAQQQYQQQIDILQAQINRWGKISELIGSKEGTKFQRIAQEHHLDILVEYANQQLAPLAPRYQLQRIENSLGLSIIDHDMNAEVRPVLSLSGGETFLVSLALALAIANMASGTVKLESLFIDEGFGTLDPTSLQIAMDALDRLQSQGRKVVLISHVQEMHERIPVQIQVKALGSGASHIQIVG